MLHRDSLRQRLSLFHIGHRTDQTYSLVIASLTPVIPARGIQNETTDANFELKLLCFYHTLGFSIRVVHTELFLFAPGKKVDAKHFPQCKRGTLNPLRHNHYGVNVKLLNDTTPRQTMTSEVHHNEEISAARAKVVLGLSGSLISFLEVYYHQAEPLTEYSSGVVQEKATAYSQHLDCQASTFSRMTILNRRCSAPTAIIIEAAFDFMQREYTVTGTLIRTENQI